MACLDKKEDDADGDEHQGTEDGAAAQGAGLVAVGLTLGAEHVALDSGLIFENAALILPVAPVGRTGRWRIGWRRIVSHGLIFLPGRDWRERWRFRDWVGREAVAALVARDTDRPGPSLRCRRCAGRWPSSRRR